MMQGMRVKLTFNFDTVGTCAPLFITVIGLNERNLCGKRHILVRLKGLCIGEGGVNTGIDNFGYVLFMVKQENAHLIQYKYYKQNILLPFIQNSLTGFDRYVKGTPTPIELTLSY